METNEKRKLTSINLENEYIALCDQLCERFNMKRATLIKTALEYISKNNIDIRYDNVELSQIEKIAQKYETALITVGEAEKRNEQLMQIVGVLTHTMTEIKENKNLLVSPTEIMKQQFEEKAKAEEELKDLQNKIHIAKKQLSAMKKSIGNIISIFE